MSNVFTAQENYLRNLNADALKAVEHYLTSSLLDSLKYSPASPTAIVLTERRDAVSAEMRRRGLQLSMVAQLAERRNLLPKQQAIAA